MSSIITKAAAGLGAAAVALGLGATPAFAASAAPSAGPAAAVVTQSGGHWQDLGAQSSAHSCVNAVIYFGFLGEQARCQVVDGKFHLLIWVPD